MRLNWWRRLGCGVLAAGLLRGAAHAANWFPLGPYGGDARSFAVDPSDSRHVFLGTATGWIYDSHDGGEHWSRVAQIGKRNDLVIDHIVADRTNPKRLIVGAYTVAPLGDGGIFISEDYGKNWYSQAEMRGRSVRSLSRSVSNPKELVAGTLRGGVFRTVDNGVHWQQISPEGSTEIKEVQSIAIDPIDPDVIYAGTWHLPWKTTDGGKNWSNIKEGIIDDSDVFSIIVDPKDPQIVYASACSGIYKSSNAGALFHKVQGIPSTARRTRTLEQDPIDLDTVYAGTTEGLYRTQDAGTHWDRLTPSDVIVNDVYVDPRDSKHVLIATDRGGVYRSEDAGASFQASNEGFSARQVTAYASDAQHSGTVYVGVVNDKTTGGVFQSTDGGVKWEQQSEGLGGRDVFSLVSLEDGTLLAGTGHGVFRFENGTWADSSAIEGRPVASKGEAGSKSNVVLPAPTRLVSPGPVKHGPGATSRAKPSAVAPSVKQKSGVKAKPSAAKARPASRTQPALHHRLRAAFAQGRTLLRHDMLFQVPAQHRASVRRSGQTLISKAHGHSSLLVHKDVPKKPAQASHANVRSSTVSPAPVPAKAAPEHVQPDHLDAVVYALSRSEEGLFAGTSAGLVHSSDRGQHWTAVDALTMPEVHYIAVQPGSGTGGSTKPMVLAASLQRLALSSDGGLNWDTVALPADLTQIGAVAIDGEKNLWVGGREGVWLSTDYGASWKTLRNLFLTEVDNIFFDQSTPRVLVTSSNSPVAFSVSLPDHKVTYWDTGWKLRFVRPVGDHLIGATLFDGVIVEPKMVDSPVTATQEAGK